MRICLVSSQHVSYNPRLVKEADALASSGHGVRVAAVRNLSWMAKEDRKLLEGRHWHLETVNCDPSTREGWRLWLLSGVRQRTALKLASVLRCRGLVAEDALGRVYRELRRLAAREPADLFLAHTLQALPAAAWAASQYAARLGFDIEDLHSEELPDVPEYAAARSIAATIERKYLSLCDHLTASSPGIADEVARRYGIRRPQVILNVFSRANHTDSPRARSHHSRLSLYWFSQVVGPNRGLEDAVLAASRLKGSVELHFQGQDYPGYRERLAALASDGGILPHLHFHPPVSPDGIISEAERHDIGLALERREPLNHDLCISNKIFVYMAAGLAIVATATRGQRCVMDFDPEAGAVYEPGDAGQLAGILQRLIDRPERLAAAQAASVRLGRTRFNWDVEKFVLINTVSTLASLNRALGVVEVAP